MQPQLVVVLWPGAFLQCILAFLMLFCSQKLYKYHINTGLHPSTLMATQHMKTLTVSITIPVNAPRSLVSAICLVYLLFLLTYHIIDFKLDHQCPRYYWRWKWSSAACTVGFWLCGDFRGASHTKPDHDCCPYHWWHTIIHNWVRNRVRHWIRTIWRRKTLFWEGSSLPISLWSVDNAIFSIQGNRGMVLSFYLSSTYADFFYRSQSMVRNAKARQTQLLQAPNKHIFCQKPKYVSTVSDQCCICFLAAGSSSPAASTSQLLSSSGSIFCSCLWHFFASLAVRVAFCFSCVLAHLAVCSTRKVAAIFAWCSCQLL